MTAEGLKILYETELRSEVKKLRLGSEEREGLSHLLSASRRMRPGETVRRLATALAKGERVPGRPTAEKRGDSGWRRTALAITWLLASVLLVSATIVAGLMFAFLYVVTSHPRPFGISVL